MSRVSEATHGEPVWRERSNFIIATSIDSASTDTEIPMCRVQCPSAPSVVEPFYGQPGGGIEITTRFPIDVSDLPFLGFGG